MLVSQRTHRPELTSSKSAAFGPASATALPANSASNLSGGKAFDKAKSNVELSPSSAVSRSPVMPDNNCAMSWFVPVSDGSAT